MFKQKTISAMLSQMVKRVSIRRIAKCASVETSTKRQGGLQLKSLIEKRPLQQKTRKLLSRHVCFCLLKTMTC